MFSKNMTSANKKQLGCLLVLVVVVVVVVVVTRASLVRWFQIHPGLELLAA